MSVIKLQKIQLETDLADPAIYTNLQKFQETEKKYNQTVSDLKIVETQYEKVFEEMMD